ncbi:MAG: hypothetical protein MZU97_17840 [Bacillus subtilis]|nr:hypothetical protein [Bacillus subtilis]
MDQRAYLEQHAKEIRKYTIQTIATLGIGHIGGSMSIVDCLTVLYYDQMNINPQDPRMAASRSLRSIERPWRSGGLRYLGAQRVFPDEFA